MTFLPTALTGALLDQPAAATTSLSVPALGTHFALDVVAIAALLGFSYRRRHGDTEMMLTLIVLNLGLFATVVAISLETFSAGVGFGLFGMLSLIRLRSASFTSADMAYAFLVLVLGLVSGLLALPLALAAALIGVLTVVVLVADHPRWHRSTQVIGVVMDRVYHSPNQIAADVASRLGVPVMSVTVEEVDYVREVTKVSATVATLATGSAMPATTPSVHTNAVLGEVGWR